ncbi:endolytic transglycosylase MltG [Arenibaculum sp.]|jgi:UPF0755 protein|uniref:endolytic transglycosylase MltG n=1 Tax=Arenibaculum sp. TaxID=2865862 RepID=UPI002E10F159|nr:endolytic transglycosylase MltG [Arenibaculum sp.]
MRRAVRIAAAVVAAVTLVLGGVVALYGTLVMDGPSGSEVTLIVPRGAGTGAIAQSLADAGVVNGAWQVMLASRIEQPEATLKAGEYSFPAGVSAAEAVRIMKEGRSVVRRLTVPEGLTSAQVMQLLAEERALSGDVPEPPPEGTLLPETYHFSYGDSRSDMVGRMMSMMDAALAEAWPKRAPNAPVSSPAEAVILASIVEKETSVAEERAMVAGVFANRLARSMRLQSDPTVVYALTGGSGSLGRALTREDWKVASPYNTYASDGLPPGPIANPGRASIEAVLQPARHDYLYFVADGSGGHAFARTLSGHNRNVARWRAFRREQAETPAQE